MTFIISCMSALGWAGAVVVEVVVLVVAAGLVAVAGGLDVGTAGFVFDKAGLVVATGVGACAKADVAASATVRMSARLMFMNQSWRRS
jgi:hypothetical protein